MNQAFALDSQRLKVVIILALGTFAMGNAKFSIMPLAPLIAADLQVPTQSILSTVLAYFWGGLVAAPIIAILCRNYSKDKILAILSIWCFVGNLATSFAGSVEVLYWVRWFSGIPHAAFMAFATLLMCEVAPKNQRGWYLGLILLGLSISTLIIVPFNQWLANTHSWQTSFRFVALLDMLITLFIHDLLPHDKKQAIKHSVASQLLILKSKHLWLLSAAGLCIITSMTAVWSFSIPWLVQHTHIPSHLNAIMMFILSLGFITGQLAGGWAADKNVNRHIHYNIVGSFLVASFLLMCLFDYRLAFIGIFLVSVSFATINVMMQIRLLQFPEHSLYMVMCLFNACIQLGNFIGSVIYAKIYVSVYPIAGMLSCIALLSGASWLMWQWVRKHPEPYSPAATTLQTSSQD